MGILDKKIEEIAMTQSANIDCLVSRFCIENDVQAKDVEIVNEQTPTGYKIYVRLRQ